MPVPQFARDGVTAASRHVDIRDHDVWPEKAASFQRLIAAKRNEHLVSLVAQYKGKRVRGIAIVIGDEHAKPFPCLVGVSRRYDAKRRFFRGHELTLTLCNDER